MSKNSVEIVVEEGKINIANDIIMTIAEYTAKEVEGIVSIKRGVPKVIAEYFNPPFDKGDIMYGKYEHEPVIINLSVILEYGYKIPKVVAKVQKKIAKNIKAMTDISVSRINVFVRDIVIK
ncbi:MAG: Asp23/Gls24 family envelope stress response protein [Clostridiales bacterium]|nr:Asp23/Gls24 family envelope stress response protein [Clostridiales bacterium]